MERYIYTIQTIEDSSYKRTFKATNIENKDDTIVYKIEGFGYKPFFGGYVNENDKEKYMSYNFYNFSDLWYRLYGEELSIDRGFTENNLISLLQEIREKMKQAKFECLYEVKCKDCGGGRKEFNGSRFFGGYVADEKRDKIKLEQINGTDFSAYTINDNIGESLIIRVGDMEIDTGSSISIFDVNNSDVSQFETNLLCSPKPYPTIYDNVRFTKDALTNIVINLERRREGGER